MGLIKNKSAMGQVINADHFTDDKCYTGPQWINHFV